MDNIANIIPDAAEGTRLTFKSDRTVHFPNDTDTDDKFVIKRAERMKDIEDSKGLRAKPRGLMMQLMIGEEITVQDAWKEIIETLAIIPKEDSTENGLS